MDRYVIKSNWAPYVGTDYCEALGVFDTEDQALAVGLEYAWDRWDYWPDDEDDCFEDEGPDVVVEIYDPEKHDMLKAGGGSFKDDF